MNSIAKITAFNNLLDSFLDYLENNFSAIKSDVRITRTAIDFVKSSNPRLVMTTFMSGIEKYKDEVLACNENFFLEHVCGLKTALDKNGCLFSEKLRDIWLDPSTSKKQKANIFLYLIKMINLNL